MQMASLILLRSGHPSLSLTVAYHHLWGSLLYFPSVCSGLGKLTVEQSHSLLLPKQVLFYVILHSQTALLTVAAPLDPSSSCSLVIAVEEIQPRIFKVLMSGNKKAKPQGTYFCLLTTQSWMTISEEVEVIISLSMVCIQWNLKCY